MNIFFTGCPHFGHYGICLHANRKPWIYKNPDFDPNRPKDFKNNNPWSVDIERHDEELIEIWNSIVGKKDTIYILGDFAFKDHKKYISALNGNKVLIKGNHDKMSRDCYKLFKEFDVSSNDIIEGVNKECTSMLKRFKNGDVDLKKCRKYLISSIWSRSMEINDFKDIDQISNECYDMFDGVHEMGIRRRIHNQDITLCHYAMRSWASSCHGSWSLYSHSHGRLPEFDNMFSFDVGVDVWGYSPVPWDAVIVKMKQIQDKIDEAGGRFVDGEFKASGIYSKDPDERVIDTRKMNKKIIESIGMEIIEEYWPETERIIEAA